MFFFCILFAKFPFRGQTQLPAIWPTKEATKKHERSNANCTENVSLKPPFDACYQFVHMKSARNDKPANVVRIFSPTCMICTFQRAVLWFRKRFFICSTSIWICKGGEYEFYECENVLHGVSTCAFVCAEQNNEYFVSLNHVIYSRHTHTHMHSPSHGWGPIKQIDGFLIQRSYSPYPATASQLIHVIQIDVCSG